MHAKIISATFISGHHAKVGEVYDLDEADFHKLLQCKRIVACEAPKQKQAEPAQPPKKVKESDEEK